MNILFQDVTRAIVGQLNINRNLRRRLSFTATNTAPEDSWASLELHVLPTKDKIAGILILQPAETLFAIPYELRHIVDKDTGLSKPIICDLCKTWQPGSGAGSITFRPDRRSLDSVSILCCLDLRCSEHVRDATDASKMSRTQLREDISREQRVERLRDNLTALAKRLRFKAIDLPDSKQDS